MHIHRSRCAVPVYRHSGQRQRSLVFVLIALDDAGARGDVTGGEDVCLGNSQVHCVISLTFLGDLQIYTFLETL